MAAAGAVLVPPLPAQDLGGLARSDLPPAGFGTLRQEDVAVTLQTATLEVQILPLDERVIRLLATDTYDALHRLTTSRADSVDAVARRYGVRSPVLMLVTFYGRQDRARFEPETLTLLSQNRLFRPIEILPLSPLWNGRQLNQRETASAVYIFDEGVRVLDPMTVAYGFVESDVWTQVVRLLDRERSSVFARAARQRP
jgi:hypothetical protein